MSVAPRKRQLATKVRRVVKGPGTEVEDYSIICSAKVNSVDVTIR